jgi:hypothetical protein
MVVIKKGDNLSKETSADWSLYVIDAQFVSARYVINITTNVKDLTTKLTHLKLLANSFK